MAKAHLGVCTGGREWLLQLREKPFAEVIEELTQLAGVGPKVAACVALFSCDKHDSIPVDTHVWKLACQRYLPGMRNKTLTPKLHPVIMEVCTLLHASGKSEAARAPSVMLFPIRFHHPWNRANRCDRSFTLEYKCRRLSRFSGTMLAGLTTRSSSHSSHLTNSSLIRQLSLRRAVQATPWSSSVPPPGRPRSRCRQSPRSRRSSPLRLQPKGRLDPHQHGDARGSSRQSLMSEPVFCWRRFFHACSFSIFPIQRGIIWRQFLLETTPSMHSSM